MSNEAEQWARAWLSGGGAGPASGQVGPARLVVTPERAPHSWLVPVEVAGRVVGEFQFRLDGEMMRYSEGGGEWRESGEVRRQAEAQAREGEEMEEPYLTFDRTPERLVWALRFRTAEGAVRLMYLAGESVYEPPPEPTFG